MLHPPIKSDKLETNDRLESDIQTETDSKSLVQTDEYQFIVEHTIFHIISFIQLLPSLACLIIHGIICLDI